MTNSFRQHPCFAGNYPLLMIGGTRDGQILTISSLERYYVLEREGAHNHGRSPVAKQMKSVPVEYYFRVEFALQLCDFVWEYHFLVESELMNSDANCGFISDYHLSDTYVRRKYARELSTRC